MDFYIIPPLKHMNLAKETLCKRVYCLAHLCLKEKNPNYKEYKQFFIDAKKEGYWVTLDNGAAEQALVTEDILIDLVKELMPSEVIAPDVLFEWFETQYGTDRFISKMRRQGLLHQVEIFAVPQGKTPEEYVRSYIYFLMHPSVDTIGLSKLSIPKSFCQITDSNQVSVNRRYLIKMLNDLQLIKKPLHLLGMRNITEYKAYKGIENIRSSDSCYTILAAINGQKLDINKILDDVNETPEEYFFHKLTNDELILARENIEQLESI